MEIEIREASEKDAGQIREICSYYVLHGTPSYKITPTVEETEQKISEVKSKGHPFLVAESKENGQILGYTNANTWISEQTCYNKTVTGSIYIRNGFGGSGIGFRLMAERDRKLKEAGIRTVLGRIPLPNEGSIKLHRKLGYKHVGTIADAGYKFDKWVNVEYWQRMLQ